MGSLAVSAAINIGVGLLLKFLFAPEQPDITQTGPRLDDLSVTSSAYGKNRHLGYGTVRLNGNIFWSSGIEEVVTTTVQEAGGGKGGSSGGSVSTTTFSYFAAFAIGFAARPADRLLRVFADNKLIYDATGTGEIISKLPLKFYKGDGLHTIDPLIEADTDGKFGAGSTPAYNDTVFFVAQRWPLADFGNRIPNITAEIAFKGADILPFTGLTELPGHDIPGSSVGGDTGNGTALDPFSNKMYFLKMIPNGVGVADSFSMTDINLIDADGLVDHSAFWTKDGFMYGQFGTGTNYRAFTMYEPISATPQHIIGFNGSLLDEADPFVFPNGTWGGALVKEFPGTQLDPVKYLVFSFDSISGPGGFSIYEQSVTDPTSVTHQETDLTPQTERSLVGGPVIQNMFDDEIYWIQESTTQVEIYKGSVTVNIGLFGPETVFETELVVDATKASLGFTTDEIRGWILLPNEREIILTSGLPDAGSMVKFDLDTWVVVASRNDFGSTAKYEFATSGLWATCSSNSISGIGEIYVIDTDDLSTIETIRIDSDTIPSNEDSALQPSASYDPRSHSLIFSRQHSSSFNPPSGSRVIKVFLGRATGEGEDLAAVVTDLCERAGFVPADLDVTELVGTTVSGYTVSRSGPYRAAIEPLQKAYLFDGVESDWVLKFVKRGGATALTIAEDDIGRLGQTERIEERRVQEVELPEKVVVQFSDRSKDYEPVTAYDKRVALPLPTQHSRSEIKIDLPIVFTPTEARQLASIALYTAWAERLTVDSTLPWKYIRLDPTDVVDMIFRGETRQIRMGEIEVGADLSLDFTAVQEDVSTYLSSITGTSGDGFLTQVPFGGLPTKFIPMNLPLLSAADATLLTSNKVYYGVAGFEASWPGATVFQSLDSGVSFLQVSAASTEMSWGSLITVPPSLWDAVGANAFERKSGGAGGFTWDETTTLDVVPFRGADRWLTSTDSAVLNGANAVAIIKRDQTVEIFQFVNVATVDAATIRLSRLLRGRRGTEDYANGGVFGGESVVLLEVGRISAWVNSLSLVDVNTPMKAVTSGTLIEDAPQQTFTPNGEDLRPYSVVEIEGVRSAGDLTTTWVRRTRFNGELVGGADAPLNEEGEFYDVEYFLPNSTVAFLTRTNLTSPTDTLTQVEFEAAVGYDANQLAFDNWDFEAGISAPPENWAVVGNAANWQSAISVGSISGPPVGGGSNFAYVNNSTTGDDFSSMAIVRKWSFVDDFGFDAAFLDGGNTIDLDVQTTNPGDAAEGTEVFLRIYNSVDTLIQTVSSGRIIGTPGTWINTTVLSTVLVSGARSFDILVTADNDNGVPFDECSGAVDQVIVKMGADEVPNIDVRIYQKSQQVGRGKSTRQRI